MKFHINSSIRRRLLYVLLVCWLSVLYTTQWVTLTLVGLVVKMLTWFYYRRAICRHRRWSLVLEAHKNQFWQALFFYFIFLNFQWKGQHCTPLTMQPCSKDILNVTVVLFFLPQISLGLFGKGMVWSNFVEVIFYQKQQSWHNAISYFRCKNNFLPARTCTANSLAYSKSHFCYLTVKFSWSASSQV